MRRAFRHGRQVAFALAVLASLGFGASTAFARQEPDCPTGPGGGGVIVSYCPPYEECGQICASGSGICSTTTCCTCVL
jgi:hypothetical protein